MRPDQLVFVGQSIGCAPALSMAAQWPEANTVLVSPFKSVPAMAADVYPWLLWPVQQLGLLDVLIQDSFDNLRTAGRLKAPVLVIHGTRDQIVPFGHGVAVHEALGRAGVASRMVRVEGAGHNDILSRSEAMRELQRFALGGS